MVESTPTKLTRIGNSFGFIVSKSLIDYRVLKVGDLYTLKIEPADLKMEKTINKGNVPLDKGLLVDSHSLHKIPIPLYNVRNISDYQELNLKIGHYLLVEKSGKWEKVVELVQDAQSCNWIQKVLHNSRNKIVDAVRKPD